MASTSIAIAVVTVTPSRLAKAGLNTATAIAMISITGKASSKFGVYRDFDEKTFQFQMQI